MHPPQYSNAKIIGVLLATIVLVGLYAASVFFLNNNMLHLPTSTPKTLRVTSNGITMELLSAHTEGTNYRLEVCYILPSRQDWLLSSPNSPYSTYLSFLNMKVMPHEEGTMYWKYDEAGNPIKRCQYLFFAAEIPDGVRTLSFTANGLFARKVNQNDYCLEISQKMGEKNYPITISCTQVKGIQDSVYVQFPIELLFMDPSFGNINKEMKWDYYPGPWSFTFSVNPQ